MGVKGPDKPKRGSDYAKHALRKQSETRGSGNHEFLFDFLTNSVQHAVDRGSNIEAQSNGEMSKTNSSKFKFSNKIIEKASEQAQILRS